MSAIIELAVFNTLVPQGHPGYMRRLVFPLEFRNKWANMHIDLDRDLGTPNTDEKLLPDPAQVVLVVDLGRLQKQRILLVIRTQVLVEQVHSVRADAPVPWDEWGRDAVAIQVQNDSLFSLFTFVHGAKVMIAQPLSLGGLSNYHVRTFDFSQRGRGSLPLRDGADGTVRRALFEDGENLRFESDNDIGRCGDLRLLGDGSLIRLVSCLTY